MQNSLLKKLSVSPAERLDGGVHFPLLVFISWKSCGEHLGEITQHPVSSEHLSFFFFFLNKLSVCDAHSHQTDSGG